MAKIRFPIEQAMISPGLWAGYLACPCRRCNHRWLVAFGHASAAKSQSAIEELVRQWTAEILGDVACSMSLPS